MVDINNNRTITFKLGYKRVGYIYWQVLTLQEIQIGKGAFNNRTADYILQDTDVMDSHLKTIYESDIVQCDYGIGRVIFQRGMFMIQWIDDPEANMELLACDKNFKVRLVKIIGNAWNNPELLKTK